MAKDQFQVAEKYQRVVDLKKRVIDPAVEEINEHSNLWVRYGQRKSGRNGFCRKIFQIEG